MGLVVGRWWALLAPLGFGVWIAAVSEVDEVPPRFLGLGYAVVGGAAVMGGILLRRFAKRHGRPS